ncbi:L-ascorbate metabolism protein UlaG, beta-lactamase superfamily [Rhodoblastus acidophilus]|uniref:L-ascorbate metabolism protein UlaG, beta-lactamase superfamily n=1 Tax=Rhodoblastus acidophilus TaxID=1074 RepID=A0A212RFY5_RHOAC|nr:MBL fold metallo-hydrolase [Rhodoblastus acidophilus]SNB71198.1 L-ascorbate metabolism protein UlaG, beta-lactamase superfamily [Rhodoblastus acidophilus]
MLQNQYYSGPPSDHFDGRFFNLAPATPDKQVAEIKRWRKALNPRPWPADIVVPSVTPEARSEATRLTFVGHATVLIQTRGLNLLTDPFWSTRASPVPFVGPKRACPPAVALDALPPIDVILLSHNHYDHCDMATLRRLVKRDAPLIVTPFGNDAIVRRALPAARVTALDWWDDVNLRGEVGATLVPAQHWSSRSLSDRRMALWGGFYVRAGAETIYFAGDTGYGDGTLFKTIRARVGAPDVALLPIGAYEPRWFMADQHVAPEEAVMIFQDLEAVRAFGIHWGVIQLTDEGRDEPREELAKALATQKIAPELFVAAPPGFVWQAG